MKYIILVISFSCSAILANPTDVKMKEMAAIFGQLLPTVLDNPQKLSAEKIYSLVKRLQAIAHDLTIEREILVRDPSLKFIARQMSLALGLIDPVLLAGEPELARHVILKSLSYCVSCHLQDPGRQSQFASILDVDPSRWPLRQQARFYAATRDFTNAIIKYEYALKDRTFKKENPDQWLEDLKRLLFIIIRHKKSPSFTKEMASFFIDKSSSPQFKAILLEWRAASDEWGSEKAFPKKKNEVLAKALSLGEKGMQHEKKLKHSGFIYLVRSLGLLQDLATMQPMDKYFPQSFYYAGIVAQQLEDSFEFPIHASYFEACIRSSPRSALAKECYKKYRDVSYSLIKDKNKIPELLNTPLKDLEKVSE